MDIGEHIESLLAADLPEGGISRRMKGNGAGFECMRIEVVVAQVGCYATACAIAVTEKKRTALALPVAPAPQVGEQSRPKAIRKGRFFREQVQTPM